MQVPRTGLGRLVRRRQRVPDTPPHGSHPPNPKSLTATLWSNELPCARGAETATASRPDPGSTRPCHVPLWTMPTGAPSWGRVGAHRAVWAAHHPAAPHVRPLLQSWNQNLRRRGWHCSRRIGTMAALLHNVPPRRRPPRPVRPAPTPARGLPRRSGAQAGLRHGRLIGRQSPSVHDYVLHRLPCNPVVQSPSSPHTNTL